MKSLVKTIDRKGVIILIIIGCLQYPNYLHCQIVKKLSEAAKEMVKEVETSLTKETENLENYIRCNLSDEDCIKAAKQEGREIVLTDSNGEILKNDDGSPVIYSDQEHENTKASPIPNSTTGRVEIISNTVEPISITQVGYRPSSERLVIGANVWNVKQNKIVDSDWVRTLNYRGEEEVVLGPYYQVKNSPNHFFIGYGDPNHNKGFIYDHSKGQLYESGKEYIFPEKEDANLGKDASNRGIYVEKDRRRAVFIYKGDLWSADYDWINKKYINEKKITDLGLFNYKKIFYWYENSVYLIGGFSKEKPIVKINVKTGEIKELPLNGVFPSSDKERSFSFTNPSGKYFCNPDNEFLHCYDAAQNTFFQIPIKPDGYETTVVPQNGELQNLVWLADHVFATVAPYTGVVSRIDLGQKSIVNLFQLPPGQSRILEKVKVTPRRKFVDIVTKIRKENPPRYEQNRFLINLTNGDAIPINLPAKISRGLWGTDGEWITDDLYLYSKNDGGLNEMGTWIYSVKSGEHKKIGGISKFGSILSFPKYNIAYFSSGQGVSATYRVDIAKGTVTKVADESESDGNYLPFAIMEPPIDLGVGK